MYYTWKVQDSNFITTMMMNRLKKICKEKGLNVYTIYKYAYKYPVLIYRDVNALLIFNNATVENIYTVIEGLGGVSKPVHLGAIFFKLKKTIAQSVVKRTVE